MRYKNYSDGTYTFFGTEFKPGDVHDVPGAIHYPGFFVEENETKSTDSKAPVKAVAPVNDTVVDNKSTKADKPKTIKEETNGKDNNK